jgi:hypothetical protein
LFGHEAADPDEAEVVEEGAELVGGLVDAVAVLVERNNLSMNPVCADLHYLRCSGSIAQIVPSSCSAWT